MPNDNIREALLRSIEKWSKPGNSSSLQSGTVLSEVANELNVRGTPSEQALLTAFYDLFRTGYLAWGLNISNANPPFFHVTEQGRRTLERLSGDPGNPEGYLKRVDAIPLSNAVARSYLDEAVRCFVADLRKAAAVMVGGASESLILSLQTKVVEYLTRKGEPVPRDLRDWRTLTILSGLQKFFDGQRTNMPRALKEEYDAY